MFRDLKKNNLCNFNYYQKLVLKSNESCFEKRKKKLCNFNYYQKVMENNLLLKSNELYLEIKKKIIYVILIIIKK